MRAPGQDSRNLGGFALSEPCRTCRGRGMVVDDPCPVCSGSGRAMSTRTIQARIPAGVADGQRIKLKGKGAPGERGGPAGDLYVKVHVTPHTVFGRSGDNLTVTVPVTFTEAALGAEIKVPSLTGACRSPCGSRRAPRTGARSEVRGKGVRRRSDGAQRRPAGHRGGGGPGQAGRQGARGTGDPSATPPPGDDPRGELLQRAKG